LTSLAIGAILYLSTWGCEMLQAILIILLTLVAIVSMGYFLFAGSVLSNKEYMDAYHANKNRHQGLTSYPS